MIKMEMSDSEANLPPLHVSDEDKINFDLSSFDLQLPPPDERQLEENKIKEYFESTYGLDLSRVEEKIFVGERAVKGNEGTFNFDKIKTNFSEAKASRHRFLIQGKKFNYFRCNFLELVLYYSLGGPDQKEARDFDLASKIVNTVKEDADEQEEREQNKNLILGETVGISLLRKLDYILNVLSKEENIPTNKNKRSITNYNEHTTQNIINTLKEIYSPTKGQTTATKKRVNENDALEAVRAAQHLRIGPDTSDQFSKSTTQNAVLAPVEINVGLDNGTVLNKPGDYTFEGLRQVSWGDLRVGDMVHHGGHIIGYVISLRTGNGSLASKSDSPQLPEYTPDSGNELGSQTFDGGLPSP